MNVKARRGNVAVLLAVILSGFIAVSAVSIDLTRLGSLRNELQFSADAGAHAGAIQLREPNDPMLTVDSATAYAIRYLAMQGVVQVDSVELGGWDDMTRNFHPGLTPFNAVRVVVSRRSGGLLVSHLGLTSPRLRARAVGWVQADSARATQRIVLAQ
jgi:Flp pilus assembly protein TadG